ncbi:MAG: Gfo/Idh/MocA family oxidoreductase [Dehalococcoidia bacterium]|nr:Gfo/Idh/MocA family oxidoreductase [Dehalococcoidia bacterium]
MRDKSNIRIGVIGAGANSRLRHIPGFQSIPGVTISAVANRSIASAKKVADEFNIDGLFDDWTKLIENPDIDAICIGTWPYMHCPITLAALESGKHVLTEARMAMDAEEARNMLDASRRHPKLICQVVPSPLTFKIDDTINDVLASGYLGSIISIELRATQSNFPDFRGDMHWRNDRIVSGYNILNMGIWYESLMRWVGPASSVYASGSVTVNRRYDNDGTMRPVTIPDHVEIICDMAIGAKAHFTFSAVTGMDNKNGLWIFGSNGTLYVDTRSMSIYCANRDSTELDRVDIPRNKQSYWRVEEEFIGAIRGEEPIKLTTFEAGLRYMEFSEAVYRSIQTGTSIHLPL